MLCVLATSFALSNLHCDFADDVQDAFVEAHRLQARGKVGVFRALQTKEQAVAVARNARKKSHPACALPRAPFTTTVEVVMEVEHGKDKARVTDKRQIRADASGNASVTYQVLWKDMAGRGETWTREERVVDDRVYVKEQNLPFVRHTRRPDARQRLLDRAFDGVRTGLHLGADRWSGGPESWRLLTEGGHRFEGCATRGSGGWVERLSATATLREASAHTRDDARRFHGTWLLQTGQAMTLDIVEEISHDPTPIRAPTEVAEARRDRPYHDIEVILGHKLGLSDWKK
jgi:hypothetical protein